MRNKKNRKKGRSVTSAPLFPAIIEHEADELRETLATESQPDSPLTPIYCTISRKSPGMWPEFLGDWAYSSDDEVLHKGKNTRKSYTKDRIRCIIR